MKIDNEGVVINGLGVFFCILASQYASIFKSVRTKKIQFVYTSNAYMKKKTHHALYGEMETSQRLSRFF